MRYLACLLTFLLPSWAAGLEVSIVPAAPKVGEAVRVNVNILDYLRDAKVSMADNRIRVELIVPSGDFGVPPNRGPIEVELGHFPPGTYQVDVVRSFESPSSGTVAIGSASFSVSQRDASLPLGDYTGLWWNANESGWGMNVIQSGSGIMFVTWFAYDADGSPAWYSVSSGTWSRPAPGSPPSIYTGDIVRTTGPAVGATFNPALVTRTIVGQMKLTVPDRVWDGAMRAEMTVNGTTVTKDLRRFGF